MISEVSIVLDEDNLALLGSDDESAKSKLIQSFFMGLEDEEKGSLLADFCTNESRETFLTLDSIDEVSWDSPADGFIDVFFTGHSHHGCKDQCRDYDHNEVVIFQIDHFKKLITFSTNPPDLPELLKRLYLEDPARKTAAALFRTQNPEFKEKQIHQKVEVTRLDILDTRKMKDGAGKSYEAVDVHAEGNLVRTGTVNAIEFWEVAKFDMDLFFIRNPDLLANGRLPLVVQDFKYEEKPL
jgi:hypothetical protein